MAIQAVATFDRLMLEFAGGQRVVMTGQAKAVAFFDQQKFIGRLVRGMTAGAFAVVRRLVLHLVAVQKIGVTGKTKLTQCQRFPARDRRRIMALLAFTFGERRMNDV